MIAHILKKLQTTEMRYFRTLLGIHITKDAVTDRIRQAIGPYDEIFIKAKKPQVEVVWARIKISRACQDEGEEEADKRCVGR